MPRAAVSSDPTMTAANEFTRAYQVLKDSLGDYQLPPGRQIPVRVIADKLGIGVTPVKKACSRLTSEGWAIPGADTAYFAWCPEESAIAGLYDWNRAIVLSALDRAAEDHGKADATIARLSRKLVRHGLSDTTLAAYTGALFFAVVERTGRKDILQLVRAANERMHYLRVLECQRFDDVAGELRSICKQLLVDYTVANREKLREAIVTYHDKRRNLVPELNGMLAEQ